MRLDKIRFAKVVQFIGRQLDSAELTELDALIDIDLPQQEPYRADAAAAIDELLKHINRAGGFIETIRAYRALTGAGLKESKEAVEKYMNVR